jgi:3-phosphoshikimate 1-carboxyvinyltransferase
MTSADPLRAASHQLRSPMGQWPLSQSPLAQSPLAQWPVPRILVVDGGVPARGTVRTPGEKSISHRAVLLGALAEGESTIVGLSDGADVAASLAAVEAMGAGVERRPTDGSVVISGGRSRLHRSAAPIDCGNSGTSMRLLAGVVAGLEWETELVGDESLSRRPMDRVAEPLELMGATVRGHGKRCEPPLRIDGAKLHGIDWTSKVASAQVKSAILLAGLSADGPTTVREAVTTRTHTEEMLAESGVVVDVEEWGEGRVVTVHPSALRPVDRTVPGDPSASAFFVVAGCVVPGSAVEVPDVYSGPARLGYVEVLRRMGAQVTLTPTTAVTTTPPATSPSAPSTTTISASAGPLHGTTVEAADIPSLDEIPILAVAAAVAEGTTVFRDVGELRVKEVDRLAAVVDMVNAFGAAAHADGDILTITGVGPLGRLRPAHFDSRGDHRMAMAAAVAALAAEPGEHSLVTGFPAVATSYRAFADDLRTLTGPDNPASPRALIIAIDGPAGAGKSTVSRAVATHLGLERLDTGAMYRSVAALALARGIAPDDHAAVAALAEASSIEVGQRVVIDGRDVTDVIRSPEVGKAVSVVAANPEVRRHLVERQRAWVQEHGGGVVEGRDIGSVVFPDAALKVFLTASPEERVRRRHDESAAGVARRDRIDSTRAASPLVEAPDARVLDTTGRNVQDVVQEVLSWL